MSVFFCVPFLLLCRLTKYTVVDITLCPVLTGMLAFHCNDSQVFYLASGEDPLSSGPRTTIVSGLMEEAMEAAQNLV